MLLLTKTTLTVGTARMSSAMTDNTRWSVMKVVDIWRRVVYPSVARTTTKVLEKRSASVQCLSICGRLRIAN